jgi:hypothetical protein
MLKISAQTNKNKTQQPDKQQSLVHSKLPSGVNILSHVCRVATIILLDQDSEWCGKMKFLSFLWLKRFQVTT